MSSSGVSIRTSREQTEFVGARGTTPHAPRGSAIRDADHVEHLGTGQPARWPYRPP